MQHPLLQKIIRWFVPLATLAAFAGWLYIAPPGILGKADAVGYAVCHRISERSFHIGDRQLPLCARCSGTFTAAAVGLTFLAVTARKRSGMPDKKFYIPFALFFLAFAVDGSNSSLYLLKQVTGGLTQIPNLYIPNTTLRLFTGTGGLDVIHDGILETSASKIHFQMIPRPEIFLDHAVLREGIAIAFEPLVPKAGAEGR